MHLFLMPARHRNNWWQMLSCLHHQQLNNKLSYCRAIMLSITYQSSLSKTTVEITAHIQHLTVVLCTWYRCCNLETETMKLFIVPKMTFKRHSRSLAMAQFNNPHITFYSWPAVCLPSTVSQILNVAQQLALDLWVKGHSTLKITPTD